MIDTTKIVQALRVNGAPMTLAGSQDYQIVTAEPEDKSQGKMIYEKSSGVTLGKAVVDKTPAGKYYSSPAGLVDKIFGGTAVPSDIETYEYLLFKENEYVAGYINIGNLPELTQYALTHDSIEVIFKVNNGAEQSDILTKNSDGTFGNATNKFQTMKSQNLVEGAGSDYYTLDLQAGGVAQSFKIAETDTIQITKLKLGDAYINIDKGGSEGPFAIENLKIADGTKYKPLKDYLRGSPLYKHELEIAYSFLLPDSVEVNGPVMYHYLSNKGTQITNVSEINDNFILSGGIGKNSANTAAAQSESAALTWQLNDTLTLFGMETKQFDINFISNNQSFKAIYFALGADPYMKYLTNVDTTFGFTPYSENFKWMGYDETDHSAYRTITFETAPTGELLTWLQANAVPQGGTSTTTVLLLNINVIKAGSSITVEAVNASTMGYITGTVGTITDTVTQLI